MLAVALHVTMAAFRQRNAAHCRAISGSDASAVRELHLNPEGLTAETSLYLCEPRDAASEGIVYLANFIEPPLRELLLKDELRAPNYHNSPTAKFAKNTFRSVRTSRYSSAQRTLHERVLRLIGNPAPRVGNVVNGYLQFTRYPGGGEGTPRGLNQLHHDRNHFPDRWATFLAYAVAHHR